MSVAKWMATARIELFLLRGGTLLPTVADGSGVLRSEVLGVGLRSAWGKLVLVTADGERAVYEVDHRYVPRWARKSDDTEASRLARAHDVPRSLKRAR
jgi:hypothetical protein